MSRRLLYTLIATIIGSGIVILDSTVVTLALPHIARDLHANFADLQWITDGYALSLSSLILLGGSLGDIFGRKRVYLTGLIGFGVASLLCGLAPNTSILILIRVIQGIFGALLVPGGLAIINTNFPKESRNQAIGRWTAFSAVAAAIGPLLGGYIVDATSWRWIFYINIPLVLVCYFLARYGIKESKDEYSRKTDGIGALLGVIALGGITYGLIEGPVNHWHLKSLLALLIGVVSFILFVIYEKEQKDPMVNLKLFKIRNFVGANITTFAMYGALSGFFFTLIIYVQTTLGYSAIKAGTILLPVTILVLGLSGRVGKLVTTIGARKFMTYGPIIAGTGMLYLVNLRPGSSYLTHIFPGITLFGLGLALTVAPLTSTVMGAVNEADSGIASGINNAVSRVSGLIIIALLGLFGAAHVYKFTLLLCASMAITAGVASYLIIQDKKA